MKLIVKTFLQLHHISFQKVKTVELAIIIIISMHWAACLVYYVPMLVQMFDGVDDANSLVMISLHVYHQLYTYKNNSDFTYKLKTGNPG